MLGTVPEGYPVDHQRLLKLRVIVARVGEMDNARWWNTTGQLGELGASVLRRNFPRSYRFAAAKSVFAVARARCNEIFNPPRSMTLWNLPAALEDEFDSKWSSWIDERDEWEDFFARVAKIGETDDLAATLREFELINADDEHSIRSLKRSAEARALQIPGSHSLSDELITHLALGFSKGTRDSLTIPYARLED